MGPQEGIRPVQQGGRWREAQKPQQQVTHKGPSFYAQQWCQSANHPLRMNSEGQPSLHTHLRSLWRACKASLHPDSSLGLLGCSHQPP